MPKINDYKPVKYYFIPDPSYWPLMGSLGFFFTVLGLVQVLHEGRFGFYLMGFGLLLLLTTLFGWFGAVIKESISGLHSEQMDRTYRYSMMWFIVSEVFLFGIFFGALFYVRLFGLTELGDATGPLANAFLLSKGSATHQVLWPAFQYDWPLLINPNNQLFEGPIGVMNTWGIPALNTLILLTSAATLTWAHWGLKKNIRPQLLVGLVVTILLGVIFEGFQIYEYHHAYTALGLTLTSGIYGSTFFTLTGLHAMHVTVGVIILTVIFLRCLRGHFEPRHHFAFEAAAWYWHFVDVVWLFLFVFVYWL